jgi:phospholipid:diacylglycerol acyltransferase
MADAPDGTCPDTGHDSSDSCKSPRPALDMPLSRRNWIDYAHTDASANPQVINGVSMGEGDGTVSLLSLGAMCVEGWKRKIYNPAGIKVVTVEVCRRLLTLSGNAHYFT